MLAMKKIVNSIVFFVCSCSFLPDIFAQTHEQKIEWKRKELAQAEKTFKTAEKKYNTLKEELHQLRLIKGYWTLHGFWGINFSRAEFSNWAAGGVNSFALNSALTYRADYKKNKFEWNNFIDLGIGFVQNSGEDSRKSEDKIDILSKFSLETKNQEKLRYAALLNFKTQFAQGFDFSDESQPTLNSLFLSPAFLLASLGLDYKPTPSLSLYFSPASGKFTIVQDDSLAKKNFFIPLSAANPNFRSEFGASFTALLQKELRKSINLRSRIELFNNYSDPNKDNRKNIDISWETNLNFKISKYIGVSFLAHLLYDDDINISYRINENGIELEKKGPKIQFKNVLGIGFSYQF